VIFNHALGLNMQELTPAIGNPLEARADFHPCYTLAPRKRFGDEIGIDVHVTANWMLPSAIRVAPKRWNT